MVTVPGTGTVSGWPAESWITRKGGALPYLLTWLRCSDNISSSMTRTPISHCFPEGWDPGWPEGSSSGGIEEKQSRIFLSAGTGLVTHPDWYYPIYTYYTTLSQAHCLGLMMLPAFVT